MTDKPTQQSPRTGQHEEGPGQLGDGEPMTGAQRSCLKTSADPVLQPKPTERDDG